MIFHQRDGKLSQEFILEKSPLTLNRLPRRMLPDQVVKSVCGFCSTGCSLDIHLKNGRPINVTPTNLYPVNEGKACPKGWEALSPLKAADRATTPYFRNAQGQLVPVDWETALNTFVNRFLEIQRKYGRESTAFLSTGQIPTEEMAFLGALAKFGMGMIHGDGNTRQCMATAVVAYKESFGFDAPPYTYQDFEESDVIVLVGSNLCIAHPILWQRVMNNPHHPRIIVIDPRRTETAVAATDHYAIAPKSDLTFLYGLAHILMERGWIDQGYIDRHTTSFAAFKNFVKDFSPQTASAMSGISVERMGELARIIHEGQRVSFWWTMGVNQSYEGTRTAQALINLALMTGNIGRPGTGANSITGQCNAMGSRLFSNTTNLFGGRDFKNPQHRREVAEILKIDEQLIPDQGSWAYDQIIEGIVQHKIKGLWVIATNPLHSWINQNDLKTYIRNLDFLVVQDMYFTTETAQVADLILPAAGWGEKEGTFINSERRIGVIKKVSDPLGQAMTDFEIFKAVAKYWGCDRLFSEWKTPQAVFEILKKLSRGRPCDISGIRDYDMLTHAGGVQWPFPSDEDFAKMVIAKEQRRLFSDGRFFHADGKARFIFEAPRPTPEAVDEEYPFVLLTGRGTSAQWHTQTRTAKSSILRKMYPADPYVEMNPQDAQRLKLYPSQWVTVATRRGQIKVRVMIVPTVKAGHIFIPMHYETTNRLTLPSFDPYSRQPSYKISAAKVFKRMEEG